MAQQMYTDIDMNSFTLYETVTLGLQAQGAAPTGPYIAVGSLYADTAGVLYIYTPAGWMPIGGAAISYIDDLLDVDTSTVPPIAGQVLMWDGIANWIPGSASALPLDPIIAGAGLILNGPSTIDVVAFDGSILVQPDDIQVAPSGITTDKIADGAVTNPKLNATIGAGLTNVSDTADAPTVDKAALIWDAANLEWIPGTAAAMTSGLIVTNHGVAGGGDLAQGPVSLWADLGAGLEFDSATPYGGIYVRTDNVTLEVNANDEVAVKDLGISNRHLNATIGGLINVDISADTSPVDRVALIWDLANAEWIPDTAPVPVTHFTNIIAVDGLTGGGDLVDGDVILGTDLGDGLVVGPEGISINYDNVTVEVNTADQLQVKDLGISNRHLNCTIGGLINVDILADTPPVGMDIIAWDPTNLEYIPGVRVDLVTDQTIGSGVKTFMETPIVPNLLATSVETDPLKMQHAVDRLYVDNLVSLLAGQTSMVGTYSCATGLVTSVFSGAPPGLVVGSALPPADATNVGTYLLVDQEGTIPTFGTIGDWIISDGLGTWFIIPLTTQYVVMTDSPNAAGDVHGSYATGLTLDLGPGIDRDPATRELYARCDNLSIEISPLTAPGVGDEIRIKEAGVQDLHINAKIGALTNVNYPATSGPVPAVTGAALVWDGLEWTASSSAMMVQAGDGLIQDALDPSLIHVNPGPGITVDTNTDTVNVDCGVGIIHSPDGITINPGPGIVADSVNDTVNVDCGVGIIHSPDGITINPGNGIYLDPVTDTVNVHVDTGAGIIISPDGLAVNVDNATLEVTPYVSPGVGDVLQIKDMGVTDIKLAAQLGALTNVEMSSTELNGTQADGAVLTYEELTGIWKGMPTATTVTRQIISVDVSGGVTDYPVTHTYTSTPLVQVANSSGCMVWTTVCQTAPDTITLSFTGTVPAGDYEVILTG